MPYCDYNDLVCRFPADDIVQLTDDNGTEDYDRDAVAAAIADATADIDSYLRGQYVLPLNPVPPDIVTIAVDLTRYNLYSRPGQAITEVVKDRRDSAIRKLERLQTRVATLDADRLQGGDAVGGEIRSNKRRRVFGHWNLPR